MGEDSREKEPFREYKELGGRNNGPITMADSKKNEHLETPRSQKKWVKDGPKSQSWNIKQYRL